MTSKTIAFWASLSMAMAILLGAWNAHGMENFVTNGSIHLKYLKTFHTGVEYQFYNSLGLLILGLYLKPEIKLMRYAVGLIFCGMCIFCFSLYLLSFHQLLGSGWKILGAITPIGGLFMALGWVLFAIALKKK